MQPPKKERKKTTKKLHIELTFNCRPVVSWWTSPLSYIVRVHLSFKGCRVYFLAFILFLINNPRNNHVMLCKEVKNTDTGAPIFFIGGPIINFRWTDKKYRYTDNNIGSTAILSVHRQILSMHR